MAPFLEKTFRSGTLFSLCFLKKERGLGGPQQGKDQLEEKKLEKQRVKGD